jgi:hypothetical protein
VYWSKEIEFAIRKGERRRRAAVSRSVWLYDGRGRRIAKIVRKVDGENVAYERALSKSL